MIKLYISYSREKKYVQDAQLLVSMNGIYMLRAESIDSMVLKW